MPERTPVTAPIAPPETLSVREAARILGVTPRTVYNWIAEGTLRAQHLSERVTRVPLVEIERLRVRADRPDLSSVLWDVDPRTIDEERDAEFIIARVLEAGRPAQVRWLFARYPLQRLLAVTRSERRMNPRAATAWRLLLEERVRRAA